MTVCFLSTQYLPTVGGVERYTFSLARRLAEAGHRVMVMTTALPGLPEQETDEFGIEIHRLPTILFMHGRFPWPKPFAYRAAAEKVWGQKIDFCVIQTRFYPMSVAAARACRCHRIPAIVIDHSTGHMPMGNPVLNLAGACYEHLACALIRPCVQGFYGVSQAVCGWLTHFGISPSGTLHNAVDPEQLLSLASTSRKNWRESLGLSPEKKLIAFVGRLIPEKGAAQLSQAFASLQRQDAALLVAGGGPQLAELQANPLPNVYHLGEVPYPDTLQLLMQADLFCLPTTYAEGFPTTFLEAAACGCPILTTRTGGSDELMPTPDYGLQLPDSDPAHWAEALQKALDDNRWRRNAAVLCGQQLRQHFTWAVVARQLEQILSQSQ